MTDYLFPKQNFFQIYSALSDLNFLGQILQMATCLEYLKFFSEQISTFWRQAKTDLKFLANPATC